MGAEVSGFELAQWQDAALAIEADLIELTSTLTEAQFHASPRAGGWSIGLCLEHLILTGHALLADWDAALRSAKPAALTAECMRPYPWWRRMLLQYAENPHKLKLRASTPAIPYLRRSIKTTMEAFFETHQGMARRAADAAVADVYHARVRFPPVEWLRHPLDFTLDLALAHERRHMRQAWAVRRLLVDGG